MLVSRLVKITLLTGLLFVGQGAQAMLSKTALFAPLLVKNFSNNFALPKQDPDKDPNFGGFVSKSWHREQCEKIKNSIKTEIDKLKKENQTFKKLFSSTPVTDYFLGPKKIGQQLKSKLMKQIAENKTLEAERKKIEDTAKSAKKAVEKLKKESASLKADLEKARASNNNRQSNNKQHSWWENTKQWMFKKFILASTFVGSIWYSHTPTGQKIYDRAERYIPASILENRLRSAISARNLPLLKKIITAYKKQKYLYLHLDSEKLAQLALTKDVNGEDFAKGLEILLQEKIVKLADNWTVVTNTIPNNSSTFKTCKITYNISRYVQSAEALAVIIAYEKKFKQEITDYNTKPENVVKIPQFEIQELFNQVICNPETGMHETAADIYAKNGDQELIKAAKNAGALTSKEVHEEVAKYLKIPDLKKITVTQINRIITAIICPQKLITQKS